MATKTAIIDIHIHKFRPIGAIPISADLTLGDHDPNFFSQSGNQITITIPKKDRSDIELVFRLDPLEHLLIGIAFTARRFDKKPFEGQLEFPRIVIETNEPLIDPINRTRTLRVTDAASPLRDEVYFDYVLFVQEVKSGTVGIIDPDMGTEGSHDVPPMP